MAFERIIGWDEAPLRVRWNTQQTPEAHLLAHHREVELHLVKRGTGTYFIRDRNVPFPKNSLLYIPSGCTHRLLPGSRGMEKGTVMFMPSRFGARSAVWRLPKSFPYCLSLSEHETTTIEIIFRTLHGECEEMKPRWQEILAVQLDYLFLLLRRSALQVAASPAPHPAVTQCAALIEKNYAQSLTLAEIAAHQGYSPYYLTRLFTQHTGLSLKQYILQRRIAEAKRILQDEPTLTVDAVARRVGFSDFALFNRSFKKLTGQTPTVYRKISHL